ncbi:hypothetical protein [Streptomyces sp. NEAU-S77]|uniref:hypothetical protein n=1 Tax=Streptomyces sp. NEAU-S77 TaxID=3411033 RepID=UPI003B9E4243
MEEIAGRVAGRATVAVGHDRADELTSVLAGWGIHAEPVPPERTPPADEPVRFAPVREAVTEAVA